MQRSESRAESSLSGYAERRMLSNVVQMQNAKEREQSRKLAFELCRATHALDERQMQKSERRDGENRVLSPMGLTFRENRVLRLL